MLFVRVRLQQLKRELIRGWHEVPYLYFTGAIFVTSFFLLLHKIARPPDQMEYFARHKKRYIILRPDDTRLNKYPREYITDLAVLEDFQKRHSSQ